MSARSRRGVGMAAEEHKSAFGAHAKAAESLEVLPVRGGQSCPQQCPHPRGAPEPVTSADPLGRPLTIREVAVLIGCSAWTVRQRLVPQGLPHFRSRPNGRLIFYRNQVVHWLLENQKKGGLRP